MTVREACELLDGELGSGDDPIVWRGEPTTPNELRYSVIEGDDARYCRITYFGQRTTKICRVRGTLSGMVKDRQRLAATEPRRRKRRCPTCGRPR